VWVVRGLDGLIRFRQARSKEIVLLRPEDEAGDWFHDGDKVLPVVVKTLKALVLTSDNLTTNILQNLIINMLDEPEIRISANGLYKLTKRILHEAHNLVEVAELSGRQIEVGKVCFI